MLRAVARLAGAHSCGLLELVMSLDHQLRQTPQPYIRPRGDPGRVVSGSTS